MAVMSTPVQPAAGKQPSLELFFETLNAYQRTEALKAAIELDLFTAIGEGNRKPAALAGRCGASERGLRILCDFLVTIGFLMKTDGNYELTADSAMFLDKRAPTYVGGAVGFLASPDDHGPIPQPGRRSAQGRDGRGAGNACPGSSGMGGFCPGHGAAAGTACAPAGGAGGSWTASQPQDSRHGCRAWGIWASPSRSVIRKRGLRLWTGRMCLKSPRTTHDRPVSAAGIGRLRAAPWKPTTAAATIWC